MRLATPRTRRPHALVLGIAFMSGVPLIKGIETHALGVWVDSSTDDLALRIAGATPERVFVEIRAAEIAANPESLDTILRLCGTRGPASTAVSARIAFARDAIAQRTGAEKASVLCAAVTALAASRVELARTLESTQPACARELLLESAEDLLLRMLAADASDAILAIGVPTPAERASTAGTVTSASAALASPLLATARAETAPIATDPTAFRTQMLSGMAALVEADLASEKAASTQRAKASAFLERAAQTELPLPRALADALMLSRARATTDPALRARLLADAARSSDAPTAFVARVEAWKDSARRTTNRTTSTPPFPTPGSANDPTLALLAATAEARARARNGESAPHITVALEQYLRDAAARDLQFGETSNLERAARLLIPRLDDAVRAASLRADAPPLLVALASMRDGLPVIPTDRASVARAATIDALIAPWFTVPYASALVRENPTAAHDAAEMLAWLVTNTPATDTTRRALDIVLEDRRAGALAATSEDSGADAEDRLDDILALATKKFPRDTSTDAWHLERVDLALFPRYRTADPSRAAELLLSVSTAAPIAPFRDLRSLEISFARLPKDPRDRDEDMRLTLDLARRTELADIALRPPAPTTPDTPAALTRNAALRGAIALRAARPTEAMTTAMRAFRTPIADDAAAARAAGVWIAAAITRDDGFEPPTELIDLATQSTAVRDQLRGPIAEEVARIEAKLFVQSADELTKSTRRALLPMTALALRAPMTLQHGGMQESDLLIEHGAILAESITGDSANAIARARRIVAEAKNDRRSRWLLATALRSDSSENARAEAFAIFRALAPLAENPRDAYWWRAQLAQLEILSIDPKRATDVIGRLNRLAAIDATFGETKSINIGIAQRFALIRKSVRAE